MNAKNKNTKTRSNPASDPLADPPDSIPISEFMTTEKYGRHPIAKSRNPFTCGLTGKTYTLGETIERREQLARSIGKRLGWLPNEETEWDKVACMFSFNTVRKPRTKGSLVRQPIRWH